MIQPYRQIFPTLTTLDMMSGVDSSSDFLCESNILQLPEIDVVWASTGNVIRY